MSAAPPENDDKIGDEAEAQYGSGNAATTQSPMGSVLERLREQYGDEAVRVVLSAGTPSTEDANALGRYLPPPEPP